LHNFQNTYQPKLKTGNQFKKIFFLLVGIVFSFGLTVKALENHPAGARSLALSHASVSFTDVWGTFHNQAGIAGLDGFSAGFFYESRFGVDLLSLSAGSVVLPVGEGAFGLSFFQFGSGLFKENKYALAYARRFQKNGAPAFSSTTFPKLSRKMHGPKVLPRLKAVCFFSLRKNCIWAHMFLIR
jgi:hypothetical protein